MTELEELIQDATIIPWIYRSPYGKTNYAAHINNADFPNKFSLHGHSYPSKFLKKGSHWALPRNLLNLHE